MRLVELNNIYPPKVIPRRVHRRGSRFALTSDSFINKVAEALSREWCDDLDAQSRATNGDDRCLDARFWEDFRHESQTAILAYLDVLEEAGYRIVHPDDAPRKLDID
jgi:hypothetical protein